MSRLNAQDEHFGGKEKRKSSETMETPSALQCYGSVTRTSIHFSSATVNALKVFRLRFSAEVCIPTLGFTASKQTVPSSRPHKGMWIIHCIWFSFMGSYFLQPSVKDLNGWVDLHSAAFYSYFSELYFTGTQTLEARTDCRVIVCAYLHCGQMRGELRLWYLLWCIVNGQLWKVTGLSLQ